MISPSNLYNVAEAMVPLYVAMCMGYGSMRWWRAFTPEQCAGINHFLALFAMPLLFFKMIASNNPYTMTFRLIAADSLQKLAILVTLLAWACWADRRRSPSDSSSSSLPWVVTIFSLGTLPNTIIMGVPLLTGMYGPDSGALMVQIVTLQMCLWYTVVVFLYEYIAAYRHVIDGTPKSAIAPTLPEIPLDVVVEEEEEEEEESTTGENDEPPPHASVSIHVDVNDSVVVKEEIARPLSPPVRLVLVMAVKKMIKMPSTYGSFLGLIWSLISFRFGIKMPTIIEDSLTIISTTAIGLSMFSVGTFMAQQKRIISCGYTIAVISVVIKFVVGPAIIVLTSLTVGLHGMLLHISIVQAALPLAVLSFVYAEEYKMHPDIMSTGVIIGIFVSVPFTILYYVLLGL
ncbi:probable auxin efflux carrier component 9 [Typha latifolia]|uniref:probable auxin efflux carrier component 9 n=1 Tax=Typha latifolia TaxID=4733 RepID=UPI003C2D2DE4